MLCQSTKYTIIFVYPGLTENTTCPDMFFKDRDLCLPNCGEFTKIHLGVFINTSMLVAVSIGMLSSVLVIIVIVTSNYRNKYE